MNLENTRQSLVPYRHSLVPRVDLTDKPVLMVTRFTSPRVCSKHCSTCSSRCTRYLDSSTLSSTDIIRYHWLTKSLWRIDRSSSQNPVLLLIFRAANPRNFLLKQRQVTKHSQIDSIMTKHLFYRKLSAEDKFEILAATKERVPTIMPTGSNQLIIIIHVRTNVLIK